MFVRSLVKALALVIGLSGAFTAATVVSSSPAIAANTQKKQSYFFMLREGPFNVGLAYMSFGMAKMLAEKGNDVTVFLNMDAIRFADKTQPLDLKFGKNPGTLEDVFNALVKAGGKIIACPNCSKNAGLTKDRLRKGVVMGNADMVSGAMMAADKVVNY